MFISALICLSVFSVILNRLSAFIILSWSVLSKAFPNLKALADIDPRILPLYLRFVWLDERLVLYFSQLEIHIACCVCDGLDILLILFELHRQKKDLSSLAMMWDDSLLNFAYPIS